MHQRIEQTDEEIIKMYMECEKVALANMLLQSNKMLKYYTQPVRFKLNNPMDGKFEFKKDVQSVRDTNVKIELESTFVKRDYLLLGMIIGLVISATLISIINIVVHD